MLQACQIPKTGHGVAAVAVRLAQLVMTMMRMRKIRRQLLHGHPVGIVKPWMHETRMPAAAAADECHLDGVGRRSPRSPPTGRVARWE